MQVGIMSGHFARPTLEEALDAILGHDIRHLQFNMSSAHLKGPLAEEIHAAGPWIREEIEKRDMIISCWAITSRSPMARISIMMATRGTSPRVRASSTTPDTCHCSVVFRLMCPSFCMAFPKIRWTRVWPC